MGEPAAEEIMPWFPQVKLQLGASEKSMAHSVPVEASGTSNTLSPRASSLITFPKRPPSSCALLPPAEGPFPALSDDISASDPSSTENTRLPWPVMCTPKTVKELSEMTRSYYAVKDLDPPEDLIPEDEATVPGIDLQGYLAGRPVYYSNTGYVLNTMSVFLQGPPALLTSTFVHYLASKPSSRPSRPSQPSAHATFLSPSSPASSRRSGRIVPVPQTATRLDAASGTRATVAAASTTSPPGCLLLTAPSPTSGSPCGGRPSAATASSPRGTSLGTPTFSSSGPLSTSAGTASWRPSMTSSERRRSSSTTACTGSIGPATTL